MDNTALFKISYGLYVIGTKMGQNYCGSVVDALIQAASGEVPTLALCCMKNNKTNECIKETGEFSVSVLSTDVDPFIIANFGFQSSREVDKWSNCEHKIVDGVPVLDKAVSYMRCKVTDSIELSTHTMFIADVLDAWHGSGEPLLYADYQAIRKVDVIKAFQEYKESGKPPIKDHEMVQVEKKIKDDKEKWICSICGYEYDGDGLFEELPDEYVCPICKQPKKVFHKSE